MSPASSARGWSHIYGDRRQPADLLSLEPFIKLAGVQQNSPTAPSLDSARVRASWNDRLWLFLWETRVESADRRVVMILDRMRLI